MYNLYFHIYEQPYKHSFYDLKEAKDYFKALQKSTVVRSLYVTMEKEIEIDLWKIDGEA